MLHALECGNLHQAAHGGFVEDFAVGREDRAEFEGEHVLELAADFPIHSNLLLGPAAMQTRRLKDNRNTAVCDDALHLATVERRDPALAPFDVGAGHKRYAG